MPREFSGATVGNALTMNANAEEMMDDEHVDDDPHEAMLNAEAQEADDDGDRPISVEDVGSGHEQSEGAAGHEVKPSPTQHHMRMPDIPQLLYDTNPTPTYDQAAQRLWAATPDQLNKQWARIHIDFSVVHVTLLVDLESLAMPKLCHRDSHGRWAAPAAVTHFYRLDAGDPSDTTVQRVDVEQRTSLSNPRRIPPPDQWLFKVQQLRYRNLEDALLRKTVYTLIDQEEKSTRALIHYARGEPSTDEQRMLDDSAESATPDMQETLQANAAGQVGALALLYDCRWCSTRPPTRCPASTRRRTSCTLRPRAR